MSLRTKRLARSVRRMFLAATLPAQARATKAGVIAAVTGVTPDCRQAILRFKNGSTRLVALPLLFPHGDARKLPLTDYSGPAHREVGLVLPRRIKNTKARRKIFDHLPPGYVERLRVLTTAMAQGAPS